MTAHNALPIVLSNATIPILGAVDTGVVGQLGAAAPIGAVGIGAVILASVYWIFGFLRMGTSGLVAQSHGAGDQPEVGAHLLRALVMDRDDGPAIVEAARNQAPEGLLLNAPRPNLLRFMPALNVTAEEVDSMLKQLDALIAQVRKA